MTADSRKSGPRSVPHGRINTPARESVRPPFSRRPIRTAPHDRPIRSRAGPLSEPKARQWLERIGGLVAPLSRVNSRAPVLQLFRRRICRFLFFARVFSTAFLSLSLFARRTQHASFLRFDCVTSAISKIISLLKKRLKPKQTSSEYP